MTIVHERKTIDGVVANHVIEDVNGFSKRESYRLKTGNSFPSVLLSNGYPIICKTVGAMNRVAEHLAINKGAEIIVVNFELFEREMYSMAQVELAVRSTNPYCHMETIINNLIRKYSLTMPEVNQLDAFKLLSRDELHCISIGRRIKIPEGLDRIWAQTLYVPNRLLTQGITSRQFYSIIAKKLNIR